MMQYHIGDVSRIVGMSVDTLRYYERIGLLSRVARTPSGIRIYNDEDLSRLRFIQRAQIMNFSLSEIGALLEFRKDPARSKKNVRDLATAKLEDIDTRLQSLKDLKKELGRLVDACPACHDGCAILSGIESRARPRGKKAPAES